MEDLELFLQDDVNCGLSLDDISFILMLFADDMVVLGKNPDDLQNSLNLLAQYCDKWHLQVNTDKTKVMVFRKRGGLRSGEIWKYKNIELDIVNDFSYLGTVFNYTGSFLLNQEALIGKGLKALNMLTFKTRSFPLSPKVLCQLFDAFVGSILSYACEIWGFGKSKAIERIHLKFCKQLLSVRSSTANVAVYGELGRFPLFINRYVRIIKYWFKISMSDNILIRYLYSSLSDDCIEGKNNWVASVKQLLNNYGFTYVWNNPTSVNVKSFHKIFRQRAVDVFIQSWNADISKSSSLLLYKIYKTVPEIETYLNVLPKKLRIALSKLRLGSNNLNIVTGRYAQNRVDRHLRTCNVCNSRDIEDEFHFVLICPAYTDLRKRYINAFYYTRPSVYKFIQLMQCNKPTVLRKLGKYALEAFQLRISLQNAL